MTERNPCELWCLSLGMSVRVYSLRFCRIITASHLRRFAHDSQLSMDSRSRFPLRLMLTRRFCAINRPYQILMCTLLGLRQC